MCILGRHHITAFGVQDSSTDTIYKRCTRYFFKRVYKSMFPFTDLGFNRGIKICSNHRPQFHCVFTEVGCKYAVQFMERTPVFPFDNRCRDSGKAKEKCLGFCFRQIGIYIRPWLIFNFSNFLAKTFQFPDRNILAEKLCFPTIKCLCAQFGSSVFWHLLIGKF